MQDKLDIEVGPIWDNDHAAKVAGEWLDRNPGFVWTGQWRTLRANEASVIQVAKKPSSQTVTQPQHGNPPIFIID